MNEQEVAEHKDKRTFLLGLEATLAEASELAVLHEQWENAARFSNRLHQVQRTRQRIEERLCIHFLNLPPAEVPQQVQEAA